MSVFVDSKSPMANFSRGYGCLEDPFGGIAITAATTPDAKSTTSAPALGRQTMSTASTPTRNTQSLSNTPSSTLAQVALDSSVISPLQGYSKYTPQDGVPELASPGDTESPGSLNTLSPLREDRIGKEITDENAQGYYGPGCSVFFGNLPMNMTNETLQNLMKKDLDQRVGKCYVSISRDKRSIPIAFVIFTSEKDAQKALTLGTQCVIGDRTLRPEAPKGNFIFIVFKNNGSEVTRDEAMSLFTSKGPVLRCFAPDATMCGWFDLPKNAKCVQMGTFGDFRDARKTFHRNLDGINIVPLSKLGINKTPRKSPVLQRPLALDALGIYVGNLPNRCMKEDLIKMFSYVGHVKDVQLIRCGRVPGASYQSPHRPYAFVEFADPYTVFEAICTFNNRPYGGQVLRVEFRQQTRMAMQRLQRDAEDYISRCYNQFGFQPPVELLMNFLSTRSPTAPPRMLTVLQPSTFDPITFYVATILGAQPSSIAIQPNALSVFSSVCLKSYSGFHRLSYRDSYHATSRHKALALKGFRVYLRVHGEECENLSNYCKVDTE